MRTTVYQSILNLLHNQKQLNKPKSQKDFNKSFSKNSESSVIENNKNHKRSTSITRTLKKSSSRSKSITFVQSSDNFCLQLLQEYPFNSFFINFVCYIRDSLINYFGDLEAKREGNHLLNEKDFASNKEALMDFESQIEPLLSILKDMCNTSSVSFNDFMRNIILK